MDNQVKLRRKAASKYLHDVHGVDRAPSTLAKYAVVGGGPVFQRMGRDPVYTPHNLDDWVASKLSAPMRSTSDARGQAGPRFAVTPIDGDADERSSPSPRRVVS
jgi:hypothetical protein